MTLVLLASIIGGGTAGFPQDRQPSRIQLALDYQITAGGLEVLVTMKNLGDATVSIPLSPGNVPFRLSIWDERGMDRYQFKYESTSRRPRADAVVLDPGVQKAFALLVKEFPDLPPGSYELQARLAAVRNIEGHASVRVHKSNSVDIRIERKSKR